MEVFITMVQPQKFPDQQSKLMFIRVGQLPEPIIPPCHHVQN